MLAIDCKGLTKRFGELTAVDRVSFEVKQNEVFGLLGPNGAGKTTLIRMLTTVLSPTEGTAIVAGRDIKKESRKVREQIGVILQASALDWSLSVEDNFDLYGRIQGIPKREREEKTSWLLKEFGLEERRKTKVELLSGGLARRAQIARAFMREHKILFLDEPTQGLDPQAKLKVWDLIREEVKAGETIVITTHNMEEADYLCDRVGIIDYGKIIALATPKELKSKLGGGDIIEVDLEGDVNSLTGELSKLDWVKNLIGTEGLRIQVDTADEALPELTQLISWKGRRVRSIAVRKPSLEDVFIKLTGRRIR
jgi:ABC-2 type transport system ATP-binding protein